MVVRVDPDNAVLDPQKAIGSIADCLQRPDVTGRFDNYQYCVGNGRRVLLGHHDIGASPTWITAMSRKEQVSVNYVFISKDASNNRNVYTWEELREFLKEGWNVGTSHHPGVKICFVSNRRNFRREAERVFVLF